MDRVGQPIYNTQLWKQTRKAYIASVGGLCEVCLANGKITPAEAVHHKIHVDNSTLFDPALMYGWGNLLAVCRKCHAEIHAQENRRYLTDDEGRIISPPSEKE